MHAGAARSRLPLHVDVERDGYRRCGDPGRGHRSEVSAEISNHTWLAEQRSREQ